MIMFGIHFHSLPNSGEGNGFMSPEFQQTLAGHKLEDTPIGNNTLIPKALGVSSSLTDLLICQTLHMDPKFISGILRHVEDIFTLIHTITRLEASVSGAYRGDESEEQYPDCFWCQNNR